MNNLPDDIMRCIVEQLTHGSRRLLNTTIGLPPDLSRTIRGEVDICRRRLLLVFVMRRNIRKLFTTIEQYIPSYTYSLCNYGSAYLPYNDECLIYAPERQNALPLCRFCGRFRTQHKYWKMMNLYFALNNVY